MKKITTIIASIVLTIYAILPFRVNAQMPQKMSYQAVIRNTSNELVTETVIGMRITILQGTTDGTAVYTETQTPTTNANGLVTIEIGGEASFESIDWADGPYFLKIETDPAGSSNYTITGVSQLLSVPFALHAKTAEVFTGTIDEADPIFGSSPAAGIENEDIENWNTAYGWGDHSVEGYLTSETDPEFTAWDRSTGILITESQITDLQNYLLTESDPNFNASAASGIVSDDITNWNEAYGWGDHSTQGYLTTVSAESDPVYSSSPASVIDNEDIENWNTAYGWGDHSGEGYLTQEVDPVFTAWDKSTGIQITESQIGDLQNYLLTESDPDFNASAASGIAYGDISNWNSAYGWGDHSAEGYLTSETDPEFTAWDRSTGILITESQITDLQEYLLTESDPFYVSTFSIEEPMDGDLLRYNAITEKWEKFTPNFAISEHIHDNATTDVNGFMSAGDKNKLDGIANGANVNVNADWNATTGDAQILNKPNLGVYATKDMANENITNLADPINMQDAATKAYVNRLETKVNALINWFLEKETYPLMNTIPANGIAKTAAKSGGNIIEANGNTILQRGVVWSTSENPTIDDYEGITNNGSGIGEFESSITGLTLNTKYYVRAYVTSEFETFYGNQENFTTSLSVGDEYLGGVVAYIFQPGDTGYDPDVRHGIIATKATLSYGVTWGCTGTLIGGTSDAIGSAKSNTEAIVDNCSDVSFAAKLCNDLVQNGYDDWYLPSKNEIHILQANRDLIGGYACMAYWSSTEYNQDRAWSRTFCSSSQNYVTKGSSYAVRPIRYF